MVNIASAIAALREDRFGGFWQGCTAQERTKLAAGHIDVRYANWFSGLGMNLLQLASFVRPAAAQLLLADGHVEIVSGTQQLAHLGCEYFGMYKVFRA